VVSLGPFLNYRATYIPQVGQPRVFLEWSLEDLQVSVENAVKNLVDAENQIYTYPQFTFNYSQESPDHLIITDAPDGWSMLYY